MAVLTYEVQQIDQDRWATLASIQSFLGAEGIKRLSISIDPLVDPTVVNPEQAYEISNS